MTLEALEIMKTAFTACVVWTNQLFSALDASGVILAAFCITLVVNLLFIPMRGVAVWRGMESLSDFTAQATYKPKHLKPRKDKSGYGRFSKGSTMNAYYRVESLTRPSAKSRLNKWAKETGTNVRF